MNCLHLPSVTVDLIACKRNPTATNGEKRKTNSLDCCHYTTVHSNGSPRSLSLPIGWVSQRVSSCLFTQFSHFVVGVGEEKHEERVNKALEKRVLWNFCHALWGVIFPVQLITLPPCWRKWWRWPEFPPNFLVDSRSLMLSFWELVSFSYLVLIKRSLFRAMAARNSGREAVGALLPDLFSDVPQFYLYRASSSRANLYVWSSCAFSSISLHLASVQPCTSWDSR